jgi:hypothetical protein
MYRFYTDTWGVIGHTGELGYVHPLDCHIRAWILEDRVRYYTQTAADFYQDIFPRADFSNFMARDKELATYNAITAGLDRDVRIQDRAFPVAVQGSAEPALRLHDGQLRQLPRRAVQPRQLRRRLPTNRSRRAPSRCTSSTPTSSSSTSPPFSKSVSGRTLGLRPLPLDDAYPLLSPT